MRSYDSTPRSTRSRWMLLMLTLMLASALGACSQKIDVGTQGEFPHLTVPQVEAVISCRAQYPVLNEWWVRFDRAAEKATPAN